ncbi:hypothetical protein EI534_11300 [Pseudomonas frederiksbergensis]|nr:hypothetical protein [Pseudomonas frederiksbergensis]
MILRPMVGGLHRIGVLWWVIGDQGQKMARMGDVWALFGYQRSLFQGKKKQPDQAAFMKRCLILCSLKQGRRGLTKR